VPTGSITSFDILDVDFEGGSWLAKRALPKTRIHETRSGGRHLFFKHVDGLRNSAGRVARGIDVRGDGGYVIWWPRQGLRILSDAEIGEWPDWLLRLALRVEEAPWQGNGSMDGHEGRIAPHHGASSNPTRENDRTRDLQARCKSILRKVETAQRGERNRLLNWAAYRFGWIIAEGRINPDIAILLLEGSAKICGLWHDDGSAQCRATIRSGIGAGVRDARDGERKCNSTH